MGGKPEQLEAWEWFVDMPLERFSTGGFSRWVKGISVFGFAFFDKQELADVLAGAEAVPKGLSSTKATEQSKSSDFEVSSDAPLMDSALRRWWGRLTDAERNKPQKILLDLCRAAHPGKQIARGRIRALTPHRRPGPRPIGP